MSRNTDTAAHGQIASIPQLARLVTFVLPLVLALLLLGVKAAQAAPAIPGIAPLALEELEGEEEEFEGEVELEVCESAEEEFEEGELGEAAVEVACEEDEDDKAARSNAIAPEECLLRSSHARAVASSKAHNLKLTIGYTTYEPTAATVDYSAKGGRGSLHLGAAKRHLGRSGVIRLSKELSDADMTRVRAAGNLSIRLHVAGAPRSCRRYETERLTVKHVSRRQAVWSQRD